MKAPRFLNALLIALLIASLALSGCASGEPQPGLSDTADSKTRTLLQLAEFGAGGPSLVDELMRQHAEPMLESLRGRIPDEALNELDRVFRNFFEDIVSKAIVPVYTRMFSEQELNELVAFLTTPAGKKFSQLTGTRFNALSRQETKIETILAQAGSQRDAIETFLRTPTGSRYVAKSSELVDGIEKEMSLRLASQQADLNRRIEVIRERYKF